MQPVVFLDSVHAEEVRKVVRNLQSRDSWIARIGGTPLVRLERLYPGSRVKLYGKVESCNPSGSVKDRLALYLIADAIASGTLTPESSILEASSGNTGIAMAMLGSRLGRRVVITLADNLSLERYKIIDVFGATLVLTPGERGTGGAIQRARELAEMDPALVWVGQHSNEVNSFGHYETTGREIVEEIARLGEPRVDAVVATSGTTGTLMGISARVKETHPNAEIVSVWPKNPIMGLRRPEGEKRPGIYRDDLVDQVLEITNEEAMAAVKKVAMLEGLFVGPSSGAAIVGALEVARRLEETRGEGVVVALLADSGERYLSIDTDGRAEFRA